jgi:hypothetical protein
MSVRSAQAIVIEFTTRAFATGAATNADSLPTGTLVVNGADNAASVTVTNVATGRYKAAVTLPTLAIGDIVELNIAATVSSVADNAIVWRDTCDLLLSSAGKTTDAVQTGDSFPRLGAPAGASIAADIAAIAEKTVILGSGVVTYIGPVATDGSAQIIRGNSYQLADARDLAWSSAGWPSLTNATITLNVYSLSDRSKTVLTAAGTPTSASAISISLTAAQTLSLAAGSTGNPGIYDFSVDAVLSNGNPLTLVAGRITVRPVGG